MPAPLSAADWSALLEQLARPRADAAARLVLDTLDPHFRRAVIDPGGSVPPPSTDEPLEVALWRARCDVPAARGLALAPGADGPLLARDAFRAIEAWTDAELAALHALWWLTAAPDAPRGDLRPRLARAAAWHLEHTQPDNATNRPWALHVFARDPAPEAQLYAQTLLHNALAIEGEPNALAAWIMLDAARAMRA